LPSKPLLHRPPGAKSAAAVKRELDRQRPSAARRGYGPRWRQARAEFLALHPLCAACRAQGRLVSTTVVDHIVPHRGDKRLFWDESNWAKTGGLGPSQLALQPLDAADPDVNLHDRASAASSSAISRRRSCTACGTVPP
jgi:hypothetical protein